MSSGDVISELIGSNILQPMFFGVEHERSVTEDVRFMGSNESIIELRDVFGTVLRHQRTVVLIHFMKQRANLGLALPAKRVTFIDVASLFNTILRPLRAHGNGSSHSPKQFIFAESHRTRRL